jgi:uncharacterized protein YbjT (DUF2867 family)
MTGRTAIVIGATGLVGSSLVQQLLENGQFSRVITFVRRKSGGGHPRLEEHEIDFDDEQSWADLVRGDVLFSALGTTLKTAGSKDAQFKVDYHYQYNFAKAAAANGVPVYVLVSSAMANPDAKLFYTRMKGQLEMAISVLPFQSIQILRPGILTGNRRENRAGEKIGTAFIRALNAIGLFKRQKPIPASTVAKAMINVSFVPEGTRRYELLEVFTAAGESTFGIHSR